MINFFARIGRQPWSKLVMPTIVNGYALGYLLFHEYGHSIATNLMSAKSSSGGREEMSEDLQRLVTETYDDLKNGYNVPMLHNPFLKVEKSPIKWFMTASLDPMVFGMSETKTGVLIGLPAYFNCNKEEDLPDSLFELKKFSLFKSPFGKTKKDGEEGNAEEEEKVKQETEQLLAGEVKPGQGDGMVITRIERESPAGRDFIDSLLLSEKAKKYSIAKQLHLGDSYKPGIYAISLCINGTLSIMLARAVISYFKLLNAHLSRRIPYYVVSGAFLYGNQAFLKHIVNTKYEEQSEKRTVDLGQLYTEGAEEYKSKLELRNKVLSSYLKS